MSLDSLFCGHYFSQNLKDSETSRKNNGHREELNNRKKCLSWM